MQNINNLIFKHMPPAPQKRISPKNPLLNKVNNTHPRYEELRRLENRIGEMKQIVLRMSDRVEIHHMIDEINRLESEYFSIVENPNSLLERSDFPNPRNTNKENVIMDKCPHDNTKLEIHPTYLDKSVVYCPTCFASFKGGKKI